MAGLVAPEAGAHSGIMTPSGHAAEDSVVHTAAQEHSLDARTRAVTAWSAMAARAAVAGAPQTVGQWGPVVNWPVVGINVALLPNGKVLAYDSIGDRATESFPVQNFTRATVWDPATGTQTPVTLDTGYNIFCSGLAHLVDGRIFIAGGNKDQQLNGIIQTHLFDPSTDLWALGPNMAAGRWYPTVTPLNNGEMLITSGRVNTPEVRTLSGGLRALGAASLGLPLYPWMDVAPNGLTFYSGPDQALRTLNTAGTGTWQALGQRDPINRDYGGHALFDIGKILVAGGGPSANDTRVVDINGTTPHVSLTAPMAFGRRQHNLTVLADGTVLATGGNSSGASLVDLNAGVYPAEQWDPVTGQWRTLAAMQVTRQYHSTALLLPDGRVLSAGGGICSTCDQVGYLAKNAEIFSPPYLFQSNGTLAPRPSIDAAPASATYGAPMVIATGNPASIGKVALVRLGAVTHSNNMEQRYVPLAFTAGATSITATAPANANIAPPGFYMLFIIGANGVPSVANMVNVQANSLPMVALTQPANGATFSSPATVDFAATASDSDGTVAKVEFFNGTTKLGQDTTAPYGFTWSGVAPGTYTLTARATDDLGGTTTSAAVTITVNGNTPPSSLITFRSSSGANGFSASLVLPQPAGVATGDVLVAVVDVIGAPAVTPPAGWTLVRTDIAGSGTTSLLQAVYWHLAGAFEPATWTWTLATAHGASGGILAYSGVDTVNPIMASSGQTAATGTAMIAPSITTTAPNSMLVGLFGITGQRSITPPTGMTERIEQALANPPGEKVTSEAADTFQASTGPTGPQTATANTTGRNIAQLIAVQPGSGGSPPGAARPVIDSVVINQSNPQTNDVLSATITSHDPDGDPVTYSHQWTKNGLDIPGANAATLDLAISGNGDRGDQIALRATGSDGSHVSVPLTSVAVTIVNTAPTATVALSDTAPATDDILTASTTKADADGDSVFLTYTWKVNGAVRKTTNTTSLTDSYDLSVAGNGDDSDTITVEITPNDGTTNGSFAIATATVTPAPIGITFRSAASGVNAATTFLILPQPVGMAFGDVLVAVVDVIGAPAVTPPAGWTLVRTDIAGSGTTSLLQAVYWHLAGAFEPATWTWTLATAHGASGGILAYSGVDTVNPIMASSGQTAATGTAMIAPSITTTAPNSMLVGLFGITGQRSITPPTGMTERIEQALANPPGEKVTSEAADTFQASTGPTGPQTATANTTGRNIAQLIALRPGP